MRKIFSLLLAAGLVVIISCEYHDYSHEGDDISFTWTDTDWSGGNYESFSDVDTDAIPGELVLSQDVSSPVLIYSDTTWKGFYELEVYDGRLYIGAATGQGTVDGGEIYSHDFGSDSFAFEYPVQEQGVMVMRAHDGKLYIPGLNPLGTPPFAFGNLYIFDGVEWVKKETVPEAQHVVDVNFLQDRIIVTTGSYDFSNGMWYGAILESHDEGDTWDQVFRVNPHATPYYTNFRRFLFTGLYQDRLYIQGDSRPDEGEVMYVYDGDVLDSFTLSPQYSRAYGVMVEFDDRLFFLNQGHLHIFDGTSWQYIPLYLDGDKYPGRLAVHDNALYTGAKYGIIYSSPDGMNWGQAGQAESVDYIKSLESWHGRLYIGTMAQDMARLFVSASALSGELMSRVHEFEAGVDEAFIRWDAILPPGTSIKFQVRGSIFPSLIYMMPFVGPDCTRDSFYQTSGQELCDDHSGHRFFQYRVILETPDPALSPTLQEVKIGNAYL